MHNLGVFHDHMHNNSLHHRVFTSCINFIFQPQHSISHINIIVYDIYLHPKVVLSHITFDCCQIQFQPVLLAFFIYQSRFMHCICIHNSAFYIFTTCIQFNLIFFVLSFLFFPLLYYFLVFLTQVSLTNLRLNTDQVLRLIRDFSYPTLGGRPWFVSLISAKRL